MIRRYFQNRWNIVFVLFLTVVVAAYVSRLGFPPEIYYDEVYFVNSLKKLFYQHAYDYVSMSHPPLWILLASGFVSLFGDAPAVWRLVSVMSGLALLPLTYLIARTIGADRWAAALAVFFLALDGVSLTQARIAMLNALTLLLMMLSLWAFLKYSMGQWPRRRSMLVCGVFLGLALATKLTSVSMTLMIVGLVVYHAVRNREEQWPLLKESVVCFGLIPVVIYTAVHAFVPNPMGSFWRHFLEIQKFDLHYHLQVAGTQTHIYASAWWGWPEMLRPIWYYYKNTNGVVNGIICIGNPAIFWMIQVMGIYLAWDWIRNRSAASGLILVGFLSQWLFYAMGSRVKFFHYISFAMPFVALGLAWMCRRLWDQGRWGKTLVVCYMALVIGMFIYWYPLWTGYPITEKYYSMHMWFRSWI